MENILDIGVKACIRAISVALVASIYFYFVPTTDFTMNIGLLFLFAYLISFLYSGYEANVSFKDSFIVGIMASSFGVFLGIFAIYLYFVSEQPYMATWIMIPYFMPTMSIMKSWIKEINFAYPFILMAINIGIVVIGNIIGKYIKRKSPNF